MNNELYHHGILGQKWGVRRFQNPDGSLTSEGRKRYGYEQERRDRAVYGRGGAKRISRDVERGSSISEARSYEADRIAKARKAARVTGQIGSAVGGIAGAILPNTPLVQNSMKHIARQLNIDTSLLDNPAAKLAISAGVASVSSQIGRYGGQSIGMLMYGYSPDKFR